MSNIARRLCGVFAFAALLSGIGPASAVVINRTAIVDLSNYALPNAFLTSPAIAALNADATLNVGDTLIVSASFAGDQALQWTDFLGDSTEFFQITLTNDGLPQGATGYTSTFTFNGVSGSLLTGGFTNGFSGSLAGFDIQNYTDSSFSFTGFTLMTTLDVNASPVTVDGLRISASAFDGAASPTDFDAIAAQIPAPGSVLLLAIALVGIGAVRRTS